MDPIAHGGWLLDAMRRYPEAVRPWIDLSTGISPDAYPFTPPPAEAWRRLPEPEELARLEAVAARAYGVGDPACVVAAPGTQALIQLIPRVFPQARVAIPGPVYAEHAAAWRAAGTEIAADADAPALVLCNPNNPDGRRHDPARLAAHRRELLVVDEAFADFEPALSLAGYLPRRGAIVLRSFGKAYGLAGVRLGFALTDPDGAGALRAALGPWAVSGPALAIGAEALADAGWRERAGARAWAASGRLGALLQGAGLRRVGGSALFQTAEADDAAGVAKRLALAGVLVRSFAGNKGWLRFGLPASEQAWERLAGGLAGAMGSVSQRHLTVLGGNVRKRSVFDDGG